MGVGFASGSIWRGRCKGAGLRRRGFLGRGANQERDPLLHGIHGEDDGLDLLSDGERVLHALDAMPGDLGHVHQTVDARLERDEGAEVRDPCHLALDAGARRPALRGALARIRAEALIESAIRGLPSLPVSETEHAHTHLLTHLERVARVRDSSVADLGHVDEPFDSTEVDEGAEAFEIFTTPSSSSPGLSVARRRCAASRSSRCSNCRRETTTLRRVSSIPVTRNSSVRPT